MVFIYALVDPRTTECRYVGKTKNLRDRLYGHVSDHKKVSTYRSNWVKQLIDLGAVPEMVVLEEVAASDWVEAEMFWIRYFRYLGANLTNATTGGEGGSFTMEIRTKLSERAIAQWRDPAKRPARGKHSLERKLHLSRLVKDYLADPQKLSARIEQLRNASSSPKRGENLAVAVKSPAARAAKREALQRRRTENPEAFVSYTAALHAPDIVARCTAAKNSESTRAKMSESAKKRWARDREQIIAAQNKGKRKS